MGDVKGQKEISEVSDLGFVFLSCVVWRPISIYRVRQKIINV